MTRLLLLAGAALIALAPVAKADIIYTLGQDNLDQTTADGPGPYGFMQLHKVSSTQATFTFFGNVLLSPAFFVYSFTEMALNLAIGTGPSLFTNIATQVTSGPVTYTKTPGANSTPSFALSAGGNMDGFGNFEIHQNVNPNGSSAALSKASFTLTRSVGLWGAESAILADNNKGNRVATHLIYNGIDDGTGYASNTSSVSCTPGTCPVINPLAGVPEPVSLALLGTGLIGIAAAKRRSRTV